MCTLFINYILKGVSIIYYKFIQYKSTDYHNFMGNNLNNNFNQNTQNNSINNEINNLRNELSKKIIEQQKSTINELQNKLNNYNNIINNLNKDIDNYRNIISKKDIELNNYKSQLNNIPNNKVYFNDIMSVHFISSDQNVHYSVTCLKTNTFAEVEEKLYKQYPQYRETNNNFIANGTTVLRFKTIAENKIGNGLPVTLIVPS